MTIKKDDSTTAPEKVRAHSTEGYREKLELAEKLIEQLVVLLEYDDKAVDTLLLLIDLFEENYDDALLIASLAGTARQRAFGMSDQVGQQSHEYVRSLRESHLAKLSSTQEEAGSPVSGEDEEHDTQPGISSSQRDQAPLQQEKEQTIAAKTDAPRPGSFREQRARVRHLARKIAEIGAREADALFELLAYIEPEGSTRSTGQHLLWTEAQSVAFSETFAGIDAESAYRKRFTDQFREGAEDSSDDTESEEHSVN